jgi:mannose-6-phosphate isomerase-like protein (cupin superfamily)
MIRCPALFTLFLIAARRMILPRTRFVSLQPNTALGRPNWSAVFLLLFAALGTAAAQTTGDRIDLYFGDWHGAPSRLAHGKLEERDVFTKGDALNPSKKGALLRYVDGYAYATLSAHTRTSEDRLEGRQEIYFVDAGRGTAHAGSQSVDLHRSVAILVPSGLPFYIETIGDAPLAMYVIDEPTLPGFRPNSEILARDENQLPITSSNGMWAHVMKTIFTTADGLATLQAVLTVTLDPLTIGKPHPVPNEDSDQIEEVWTALDGTSLAMIGNQLRRQTPGMSYLHIPDNKTPHTNINPSDESAVRFLYFARYRGHEVRK